MPRRRASAKKTLLCAAKFWQISPGVATLRKGVRHVARKQGFSPAELSRAERQLVTEGKLEKTSRGEVRVTPKGQREACSTVKLSPWTDAGYLGASLSGRRRHNR